MSLGPAGRAAPGALLTSSPSAWQVQAGGGSLARPSLSLREAGLQERVWPLSHARGVACSIGAFAAAAAAAAGARRRPAAAASSGDQLMHESLNREIQKLNRGKQREADAPRSLRLPSFPSLGDSSRRGSSPSFSGFVQASRTSQVPLVSRALALLCLLPPLVAAVPYGAALFVQFRLLRELLLRPLLPLVTAYYSSRLTSLFAIAALYGLVAKNRSLHPFTRAIGLQASTLMMMQFPAGFLLQLFVQMPGPMLNLATGTVFFYFLFCIVRAALSCLTGTPARLPLIGDGQQLPWRPRGGGGGYGFRSFRGGG